VEHAPRHAARRARICYGRRVRGREQLKATALEIYRAGLDVADPGAAVARFAGALAVERFDRIVVVGAGKAGARMAQALEEGLGAGRIEEGLVVVKRGHALPTERIRIVEAGHPVPNAAGLAAAQHMLRMLDGLDERTLVLCLLSGGASALLAAPAAGVTLEDQQRVTEGLLASGADIAEINAVRKHLSAIHGGLLARRAAPATVMSVVVSDVVGDRLDVIASGPTVPDPTTHGDARDVLVRRGLWDTAPARVREHLEAGTRGEREETPKPGDPCFAAATAAIAVSNGDALRASAERAQQLGFTTQVLSSTLEGEARRAGEVLAAAGRHARRSAPVCLLWGGETTVTLGPTHGLGGRNQELALSAAVALEGETGVLLLSAGTDGTDGPTDAAGAFADGSTVSRAAALGMSARAHLEAHDAHPFFERIRDLLVTGPTGTNVMDVQVLLVDTH